MDGLGLIPDREQDLFLLHKLETGSKAQPAS
jgi:hypothetical protein